MSIIVEETSETTEPVTNPTEPQVVEKQKAPLPEKFKDKSLDDVIEMYTNLEKEKGRLANEVGEVRGLTDRLLALEEKRLADLGANTQQPEEFHVDAAELLTDPEAVLQKWYDKAAGETAKQYEARLSRMESQLARSQAKEVHGDIDATVSSPEFLEFATGNQYRAQIAQAAVNGNHDALNYLLSEFSERQKLTGGTTAPDPTPKPSADGRGKAALEAARKASLESSSTGDSSSSEKIFKRAELIRLKLEDPDKYEDPAFQEEVVAAYKAGRVR